MGNVQSEIISGDNGRQASRATGAAKTATNDYDPSGEVIPDVTPFELLRTIMKLEKFERCLSCVPLNIDPRSPTSLKRDIALAELVAANENGGAAKKGGKGGVTADINDVDVMSTIEEGDDDDESTAFNIDENYVNNSNMMIVIIPMRGHQHRSIKMIQVPTYGIPMPLTKMEGEQVYKRW
ncbi:hypothetical protein QTG54_011784 [Skeletonema marinoi]|uniref:Uncharacterized protein n=1 Tax=Skeletonema marinoi TaxID=267567 RepID=A0AAD8Y126_9STRA|nr:hypothetical protein QTG54_011784 [Skeletonema marinoi]